jgi:hypothetical protein
MKRASVMVMGAASFLAYSSDAHADPYMWGVGARIGTVALPAAYPAIWPTRISKYDVNDDGETDVGANGNELTTDLSKVGGDFIFGGAGYYYLNKDSRIGGLAGLDTGKGWTDFNFVAMYEQVLSNGEDLDILAGGGVGVGTQTFKGLDNTGEVDIGKNPEKLLINYFPVRAEIGAMFTVNPEWAIQASAFGQLDIPSNHKWTVDGKEYDVAGSPLNDFMLGVELTGFYGDFKPPPKKNKGKGGGKGKGKK